MMEMKRGRPPGLFRLVDLMGGPEDWRDRALCREVDPELFYPDAGEPTFSAKKICARCEVRVDCLVASLDRHERFGVWGGMSERARHRLFAGWDDVPVQERRQKVLAALRKD